MSLLGSDNLTTLTVHPLDRPMYQCINNAIQDRLVGYGLSSPSLPSGFPDSAHHVSDSRAQGLGVGEMVRK